MIIAKIKGGLGNQLFQYSAARRLACALGAELKLDLRWFDNVMKRQYSLDAFNIQARPASSAEIERLRLGRCASCKRAWAWLLNRIPQPASSCVREKYFHFDPSVLDLHGHVYLDGNWQSERYFVEIADKIRQELTFKNAPRGRNAEAVSKIEACLSVSVHVRRGDYVSDARAASIHGPLPPSYYRRGLAFFSDRVNEPCFFVFSDDPDWAARTFPTEFPRVVMRQNGPDAPAEDLRLMSLCKHHIIANSTFSWWGAWLRPQKDSIVIAPTQWFSPQEQRRRRMQDLIPEGWITF